MSSYHVPGPPRHTLSRVRMLATTVVVAALLGAAMPAFGTITISVAGTDLGVPRGTTVDALIAGGVIAPESGSLLDAEGSVIREGGGEPGRVLIDGKPASAEFVLSDGLELDVVHGSDIPERIVTTQTAIEIPVVYEGKGALLTLVSPGAVGLRELQVGEYSGRVEASRTVYEPSPMVVRRQNPQNAMKVALTFDDGPWPVQTDQILAILEREEVPATFFLLGKQVRRHRDITARVAAGGHLVANHSLSHAYLRAATPEQARSEIENCQAEIEKTLGFRPTWYRPAGGVVSPAVWAQARESKVRLVTWSVDPQDYRVSSPVVLARRVIDATGPGSVILLHDGGGDRTATVSALTTIIREIKARGYTFVTLDELYGE